jgi:hypothetical protein
MHVDRECKYCENTGFVCARCEYSQARCQCARRDLVHADVLWPLRFQRFWEQVVFVYCLEVLEDVTRQATADPSRQRHVDALDSSALSACADAIDFFVALGLVTLDVNVGRRRIGRWKAHG